MKKPAKKLTTSVKTKAASKVRSTGSSKQPAVRPLFWALLVVSILVTGFVLAQQHRAVDSMYYDTYQQ